MKNQKFKTKVIVNIVITLIVTMSMSLYSQDANQKSRISLGFNAASMNSFTNNILNSGYSNDLYVSYAFNSAVALNLGYNTSAYSKKTLNVNQSVIHSGLLIGVDYLLKPRHEFLSSSFNFSLVNSFTSFEDFKNSHVDLSYRLNFYKTFYLGLGVNYAHNNIPEFSANKLDNVNLVLQIGIRGIGFKFGRK
ncbi:MAG: hypothetical protein VB046_08630 [Paludibacter sp.]|jgi:hypothetical protein|nr:hypothetical protein [Paludibacter sp.]